MISRHQLRKSKLEKALIQALNEIILLEMDDERLKREMITLTQAELNDDFSQVTFSFTCPQPDHRNKITKILYQGIPYFRSLLSRKVIMKSVPQIKFFYDHKNNQGQEVTDLIERLSAQYRKNEGEADKSSKTEESP